VLPYHTIVIMMMSGCLVPQHALFQHDGRYFKQLVAEFDDWGVFFLCSRKHCVHSVGAPNHLAMCGICMCSISNAYGPALISQYPAESQVAVKMWVGSQLDLLDQFRSGKNRALNVSKIELLPAHQDICLSSACKVREQNLPI
jgi:hypothetical protein